MREHDVQDQLGDPEEICDRLDGIAAEFLERRRQGELPSIEEYAGRYPDLAGELREFLPTLAQLEQFKQEQEVSSSGQASMGLPGLSRLGDFRLVRVLGRGGMGVVYEAEQESLRRRVALKVLGANIAGSARSLARFRREAEAAARLHHTNIVPVFGVGEENGVYFYAMQCIDGPPLSEVIARLRGGDGTLSISETVAQFAGPARERESPPSGAETVADEPADRDTTDVQVAAHVELLEPSNAERPPRVVVRAQPQAESPGHGVTGRFADGPGHGVTGLHSDERPTGRVPRTSPVDFRQAAEMIADVADALHFAHAQGVLHRDVKPSNILIDRGGTVWITDFGLAKHDDAEDLTRSGDVVGTLRYMAPEQLSGTNDPRSDVYSLGLTLFELLALRPAFEETQQGPLVQRKASQSPPALRTINHLIPRDLETIVQKACALEPGHRYQTAAEFADDLRRYLDERPIRARRISSLTRAWLWARRNPVVASLTALAAALLLAVGVAVAVGNFRTNQALAAAVVEKNNAQEAENNAREAERSADRERDRAERNLKQAVAALDEIIDDISARGVPQSLEITIDGEDSVLQATPLTSADAELLKKLLQFFDGFATSNNTDLTEETARTQARIADIRHRLGQLEEAEDAYRQALATYERLRASVNDEAPVVIAMTDALSRLGTVQADRGQVLEALQTYQDARDLLVSSAKTLESDAGRFALARTRTMEGSVGLRAGSNEIWASISRGWRPPGRDGEQGRFGAGRRSDGGGRGRGRGPDGRSDREDRPRPEPQFGGPPGDGERGRPPDDGERGGERGRPRGDGEFVARPGEPDRSGPPPGAQPSGSGRLDEGREGRPPVPFPSPFDSVTEAIAILEDLVQGHPENVDYQLTLAQSYRLLMWIPPWFRFRDDDQPRSPETTREEAAARAVEILEALAAQYPDSPQIQFELAETLCQSVTRLRDDRAEEHRRVARADAICTQLMQAYPQVPQYQTLAALIDRRQASLLLRENDPRAAQDHLSQAADAYRQLTARLPSVGLYPIARAQTLSELAAACETAGDPDAARRHAAEAVAVAEQLAKQRSEDRFVQRFVEELRKKHDQLGARPQSPPRTDGPPST